MSDRPRTADGVKAFKAHEGRAAVEEAISEDVREVVPNIVDIIADVLTTLQERGKWLDRATVERRTIIDLRRAEQGDMSEITLKRDMRSGNSFSIFSA